VLKPVVVTLEGDVLPVEEGTDELRRLAETLFADPRRVERKADGSVFRPRVTGTEAHLEPAPAEVIEGGQFLSEHDRMSQIVVQYESANVNCARRFRNSCEHSERSGMTTDVVSDLEDVEAGGFRLSGSVDQLSRLVERGLVSESEPRPRCLHDSFPIATP
jgi:hypothetical protein